jgi:flagellar FliL protein
VDSQDTAIEVKDRELEILDIIQRVLENFAYSDVNSMVGKIRMKSAIKDRLNEVLNQGKVFHVYFNTFITNY